MSFTAHADDNVDAHNELLSGGHGSLNPAWIETVKTAPIFTSLAGKEIDLDDELPGYQEFALLGRQVEVLDPEAGRTTPHDVALDGRLFLNGNAPLSAFICGVQGSGKSNTLSCMLENFLLSDPSIGELPAPLTGLVFHYDKHLQKPCEAAYLASRIPVTVLVAPSSFTRATKLYPLIPGANERLTIRPLRFRESDLDVTRMLTLMAVDLSDDKPPLYMEVVRKILRAMANTATGFNYKSFKLLLKNVDLTPQQRSPLNLRLEILESFMATNAAEKQVDLWSVTPGHLTIIDLSDPFVDESTACSLFDICLHLFLDRPVTTGKVIAVDEAHKYMLGSASAQRFTDTLLSTIRLQRHLGTRVVISTQEPTISSKLLDLCSFTIVHRFSSPEWLSFLKAHIAAAEQDGRAGGGGLMTRVVGLDCGEAFVFAPSGLVAAKEVAVKPPAGGNSEGVREEMVADEMFWGKVRPTLQDLTEKLGDMKVSGIAGCGKAKIEKIGVRYMRVRIRKRVTEDGGRSLLAMD